MTKEQSLLLRKFGPAGPSADYDDLRPGEEDLVIVYDGECQWVCYREDLINVLSTFPDFEDMDQDIDYDEGSAEAYYYSLLCRSIDPVDHPANFF